MKQLSAVVFLLTCLLTTVSQGQSIELKNISVEQHTDHWQVTPHYDIELSEAMIEAIHNGIEVTFVSEIRLIAEKNWWPDQTLLRREKRFEIHYFSLSSQYQLKQLSSEEETTFMSLDALLEQLTRQTSFSFAQQSGATAVETRFYLDQRALPSTMQLPILLDPQWSLKAPANRQTLPVMDEP